MSYSIAMLSVHTSPLDIPGRTKDTGGMNVYIQQLARELGNQHTTVDIYTRRTHVYQPSIVQLSPHARVIHISAGPLTSIPKDELYPHLSTFVQHIDEFKTNQGLQYDVLHSHYWLSGVAGMQLAQRWDIPHVTMFHTLGYLKQQAHPGEPEPQIRLEMERQLIKDVDRIIAATADERMQMIRHCGATAGQVQVIPCGVNLKLFVPQNRQLARRKLGLKPDVPVLLFVGRLDPFKGPDLLLRAAAMMEDDAHIVMVGGKLRDDKELHELRKLAAKLELGRRVQFLGAQPQEELPAIYSAADVTVIPSYHESFGLAAVESLACGTPVVATRSGGLTTIVRDGETGYLVPRCPGFFAERLDTLLHHPSLLAQMRQTARPSVLRFSWKNVAEQMRNLYDDVLSETRQLVAQ